MLVICKKSKIFMLYCPLSCACNVQFEMKDERKKEKKKKKTSSTAKKCLQQSPRSASVNQKLKNNWSLEQVGN